MDYNTTFLNIVQAMFISHAYFFVPPIIVTFQSTMPGFRWHDYSRFREIILLYQKKGLFTKCSFMRFACIYIIYISPILEVYFICHDFIFLTFRIISISQISLKYYDL